MDIVSAAQLAYKLTTDPNERAKFAASVGKITDALANEETRSEAIKLIGSELGDGLLEAFNNFGNDPDYYAGYLAGSVAAGGAISKLAKFGAVATKLDKIVDTLKRVDIHTEGFGSNGGNIRIGIRPRPIVIGQSDGGAGIWTKVSKPVETKWSQYQEKVTGAPSGVEYVVDTNLKPSGVKKFDGFDPSRNALIDAKDWNNWPLLDQDFSLKRELDNAKIDLLIATRSGHKLEWHFSTKEKANQVRALFRTGRIDIIVKHTPNSL